MTVQELIEMLHEYNGDTIVLSRVNHNGFDCLSEVSCLYQQICIEIKSPDWPQGDYEISGDDSGVKCLIIS